MENILSSLHSLAETWLTFGSTAFHVDPKFPFLSGLGLLLLYICYLILNLVSPSLWRNKYSQKLQEEAETTWEAFKGAGTFQRGAEERTKLQTTWQSPLGEPYDATRHEQRRCPDPLFGVCHKTTDKVGHLLSQATLEDSVASHVCLTSTASLTETSFILSSQLTAKQSGPAVPAIGHGPSPLLPSILSSNRFAPFEDLLSSTTLRNFLMPESMLPLNPKFLLDPTLPCPLASFPLPTEEAPESEVVFQQGSTKPLVGRPSEVSTNVPTTKGTGCVRQAMGDSSEEQPAADNLLSLDLACSFNQHLPDSHASQPCLQGDGRAHFLEPGNPLPSDSDALTLLEKQDKKGGDSFISKDKERNKGCFVKSPSSSQKLSSAESLTEPQGLAACCLASNKDKYRQHPHSKTSKGHEEPKLTQHFWGPPSLHSEALHSATSALCDPSSTFVCFNSIAEASTAGHSSVVTLPTLLSVTKSQSLTWLQILSQSHDPHDPPAEFQAQPQPQPQTPVSAFTSSPQSDLRICGVRFHTPQEEAKPLEPSEIHCLEYNILKKQQERVWGLPSVVQKSQDTFCPSPPKLSLGTQSFKTRPPRPILPGDYPLTNELRKKLEHHLRKRLIQHRWGLPHRIDDSVSLMSPHSELANFSDPRRSHGLSSITLFKHRDSKELHTVTLRRHGNKRMSENHRQGEIGAKAQTYNHDIGLRDHQKSNFQEAPENSLQSDMRTDRVCHARSQPGRLLRPSQVSQCQKGLGYALEEHLNKKTKEIRDGQIPGTVGRHWHVINLAQPPPKITSRQMKDRKPLAGKEDPPKKHQRSLSLSLSREKVLEEHIKSFGRRMTFGLPQRVEESFQSYMTRAEPPHPLPLACGPSETFSGVGSGQASMTLRKNTSGDRMGTTDLIPIQEGPRPATPMGQPASENKQVFADKDLSIVQSGREPIQPRTPGTLDTGSLQQPGSDKGRGPEQPTRAEGPKEERLASCANTHGPQQERGNPEGGSRAEGFTELLKGEEPLPGLYLQPPETLTATRGTCSPGSHVTACQPVQGMSVSHEPDTADYKSQVSRGVMLNPGSGTHTEAPGLPPVPFASEEVTSKPQASRSGAMATFRVLHVQLPSAGISMEPRQALWVPAHVSGKCQDEKRPPAAKDVSPLANEAGKLGGGDAGLGAPHSRGKRHSVQARAPEGTHAHASSLALSPMRRSLENQFSNQVRCFLQWLSPGRKHRGQERPLAKGSSSTLAVGGTSPIKGRCEFCGHMEAQKCVRDPGVVLRRQLEHRHGEVTPCPQAPVCPLMGSEDTQQEEQLQAQAEPVQRSHPCCQASCSQVQRAESCSPGQGQMAPGRYGITRKAKMVQASLLHASQGARVPWQSSL